MAAGKMQREQDQAPVAAGFSVKATRGPVQAGEELLSILPDGEELLLEVKVLNRDIGFEGMKAKVKMATFPFQELARLMVKWLKLAPMRSLIRN